MLISHSEAISYQTDCWGITEPRSSDTGNLDMLKRSSKVLSLSENVQVLDNNKSCIEVGKIHSKNKFSIHEIMMEKKKKEIQASFAAEPQTAKIMDKCLVKMEKALNLWMDNRNTKHISSDGCGLHQKAQSLQEDLLQQVTLALLQVRDDYTDSVTGLDWKM